MPFPAARSSRKLITVLQHAVFQLACSETPFLPSITEMWARYVSLRVTTGTEMLNGAVCMEWWNRSGGEHTKKQKL
ncbi:hypothetical protein BDV27DRAFT_126990 [Aspergillus caelatus]|uniref:Uncharacterized protein n=1 Tax=Aspergillus caelatus TaxID=61420 RepID=A0A5N7A6G3_9EURO|nr:uncharacterized protein BDV27DRAFT_126990 [Aspergillus caelatus]KAE8365451.1 hypothetical protein BDV27DRAFT_126990 [Aspergillus caelatus]